MSLEQDIEALRRHLDELARESDDELERRYSLRWPPLPPGVYWQLRWLAGTVLRGLERIGILRPDPWPVSLRSGGSTARARPLLIWAVGSDRDTLREACAGLSGQLDSLPGFAPVLITDVADFAFFSRLGWLVEYLPPLSGEGEHYDRRKARLLARLYHGAPVLPVGIGLDSDWDVDDVRRYLVQYA